MLVRSPIHRVLGIGTFFSHWRAEARTRRPVRRSRRRVGLDTLMDELIDLLETALQKFDDIRTLATPRRGFHYQEPDAGLFEHAVEYGLGNKIQSEGISADSRDPYGFLRKGAEQMFASAGARTGRAR